MILHWDSNQEQKDKYAAHIRKCAKSIADSDGMAIWSKLNNLWCFLDGCGYSEAVIQTLKDSADYFCNQNNKDELVNCINDFANNVSVMELPQKKREQSSINISNSNSQTNNFKIIEEAISNELSSSQIEELKNLLKRNKRGDIKEWLSNLSNNTLGGILSTIITNIPGVISAL